MEKLLLTNARIYQNGAFFTGSVMCQDGKITAIGDVPGEGAPTLDCGGHMLSPGFLDAHTHGAVGVDVNNASPDQLGQISAFFASQGTTGWLASVLTDTEEQTLLCIDRVKAAMEHRGRGAQLLGIHMEGPFLSPQYKGAMPEHLLRKGNLPLLSRYRAAADGAIKYITLSPEVEDVLEIIPQIAGEITVAIGHSGADYDCAMESIQAGARCATHTFNAMLLFHQHRPAIMGAALESDIWCEAICDGRHLHPGTVRLLLKTKGYDRVIAVTDSIMAAGLPDGKYKLGVNDVVVVDGDAMLADGTSRAGSTLTMIQALSNLLRFTGSPVEKLLPLLTINPARALRMDTRKGSIEVGKDADFVLLGDDLTVHATVVSGAVVYRPPC